MRHVFARKSITPTLWHKFIIYQFSHLLCEFRVVKVKGYGKFLVDEYTTGQRKTVTFPWWEGIF